MPEPITMSRLVDELRDRLCRQWKAGEHVRVEALLADYPQLRDNAEGTLQLVYQEVLLRARLGEQPALDEYTGRFPSLGPRLERLFAVHDALESPDLLAFGNSQVAENATVPGMPHLDPAVPPHVPGYEILGELGRGGAGIVYRARQMGLNRLVALKTLLVGAHASAEELKRFHKEAEAQAKLQHPNIVQIYEVGECRMEESSLPLHYLAMELLEGGSLHQAMAAGRLEIMDYQAEVPGFMAAIARAMHYAHQRGILHRDLKPGNILLQLPETSSPPAPVRLTTAVPKIADFGLAKRLQNGELTSVSGHIVGTPCYMAPEQAMGHTADLSPAVDVYALGAILYEVLTGRPPFAGGNLVATLLQVRNDEPVSVRRLQPRAPRDLETICLKCLHKDPRRRYPDAEALADDLDRFRQGRPIVARPTSPVERLARWCRRNPALAAAAVTLLLTIAVAFALITHSRNEAVAAHAKELDARRQVAREAATSFFRRALSMCEDGEVNNGMRLLVRSLERAQEARDAQLEQVIRLHLQAWSPYLISLRGCVAHGDGVLAVAVSPDGKTIAVAGRSNTVQLWDAQLEKPGPVLEGHGGAVTSVAFSHDGKLLLTGSQDTTARLWDVATGKPEGEPMTHPYPVLCVAFSPDDQFAATGGDLRPDQGQQSTRIWKVENQAVHAVISSPGAITVVKFSPDGKTVATASRNFWIRLYDARSGARVKPEIERLSQSINALAFLPDGKALLSGGHAGLVQTWDLKTGLPIDKGLQHRQIIEALAVTSDGRHLATGSTDRTARVWDLGKKALLGSILRHEAWVTAVAFTPDGRHLLTGARDGPACLWEINGILEHTTRRHRTVYAADYHPTHMLVAVGGAPMNEFGFWDWSDGQFHKKVAPGFTHPIRRLAFSADGRRYALSDQDGVVKVWDWEDRKPRLQIPRNGRLRPALAISPDGKLLVVSDGAREVHFWDLETGNQLDTRLKHTGRVRQAAFARDGKVLYTGSAHQGGGRLEIWNMATGRRQCEPLHYATPVASVGLNGDGTILMAGCEDGTITLYDTADLKPRGRLTETGGNRCMALSPDGRIVLTDSYNHTARLWDVETGLPLGIPFRHDDWVEAVAFRPDGRQCLTGGRDGTVRLWPIPEPRQGTLDEIRDWIEGATRLTMNEEDDGTKVLDVKTWRRLRGLPPQEP